MSTTKNPGRGRAAHRVPKIVASDKALDTRNPIAFTPEIQAEALAVARIMRRGVSYNHYVFKLRTVHGLSIETLEEKHGGQFAGTHARYVLRSAVTIVETSERAA